MEELNDAYPYDVEKAKQLLADAGYADGFTMDITCLLYTSEHLCAKCDAYAARWKPTADRLWQQGHCGAACASCGEEKAGA